MRKSELPVKVTKTLVVVTPTKQSMFKRIASAALVPVVLILVAVMSWIISSLFFGTQSLRLDESQSIWQVTHTFTGMLDVVAQDVHMPLYHIILHYWIFFFGTDVVTVRLLSFIFFALSLPFLYLLSRHILSRNWALFVVFLYGLSPFVGWYSTEARMYTLLALMTIINQYFFVRILKGKKNSWLWYLLSTIVGSYSHYFFFFNLAAQALFFLINIKSFPKKSLRKFFAVIGVLAVALSPWIYYFLSKGAAGNTRPNLAQPDAINFFNTYSQFLFGFQGDTLNAILISFWPLTVVLAFILVRRHTKASPSVLFFVTAAFVPVIIAFVASFIITPFFLSRYMIGAVAALLILMVWVIANFGRKASLFIASIVVLITLGLSYVQITSSDTPVKEDYQGVERYVTDRATPSDLIIMSSPFTVYPFEYYYQGTSQIRTLPIWDRQNPGAVPGFDASKLEGDVTSLIKGHDYVYLILSYDQGYEEDIYDYFLNHFEMTDSQTFSPKLGLFVFRVGYEDKVKFNDPTYVAPTVSATN